jgi:glutathione synthase/RimK-type ligase-like ATP-grasp enzyme
MLGTVWNYQDKAEAFLARLEELDACGIQVCNPPDLVRWNANKTYLRKLEEAGARIIPTLWQGVVGRTEVAEAFYYFDCEQLVVKRQVGAGAEGQMLIAKGALPGEDWRYGHAAMLQPFLPAITREGELSFIFIDGELSHALRKSAPQGEYRIQSLYGGTEAVHVPTDEETQQARAIIDNLPFDTPLYARIDMLRSDTGRLLLMEAEMIEPYLYPEQGPQLGENLARAIARRVSERMPSNA